MIANRRQYHIKRTGYKEGHKAQKQYRPLIHPFHTEACISCNLKPVKKLFTNAACLCPIFPDQPQCLSKPSESDVCEAAAPFYGEDSGAFGSRITCGTWVFEQVV
ncbi:MAG: hypothetical protein Q4C66_16480 [Lachnospiraceae bacterium]|nr:hypothetical protein [Lachnospiraceae bacterium]